LNANNTTAPLEMPAWNLAARRSRVPPSDFGKLMADETDKWGKVVKFSGAKPRLIPLRLAFGRITTKQ
jgi:hypothetical protein